MTPALYIANAPRKVPLPGESYRGGDSDSFYAESRACLRLRLLSQPIRAVRFAPESGHSPRRFPCPL